jgi:FkbM family methyltransferase
MDPTSPARAGFEFLQLRQPLRCLDVGALALEGESEPWVRWAQEGCAEVIGFEPIKEECERLNLRAAEQGGSIHYLPWALGDGKEHTLHVTNMPMTSSLYAPARSTIDLFSALGDLMQVEERVRLMTRRLDDVEQARHADFIKLDVQGAELMVLKNATSSLRNVAVLQCEVEFIELYEGQPLFADVDAFLRAQGFCFLRFAYTMGRPFRPLQKAGDPGMVISQLLWADAIYVKDFRQRNQWTDRQLKAAVFLLQELYGASDLASLLLAELDHRQGSQWQEAYLRSVLDRRHDLALQTNTIDGAQINPNYPMSGLSATVTVTLVDGTKVVVPHTLEQITPYVLKEQGDWFEDEIKFLRRLVKPGHTVVDIGANAGVYALSLGRRVGSTGQVWAFEPASSTADLLAHSIAANQIGWIHLDRRALSDHEGTAWLQTPGQSELNCLASDRQGPGEEVAVSTLDACFEEFGWQHVDLLKIDAEGEEERILAGGQRFFHELSPLVMFELKAGIDLHLELVQRFQELGYDCFRLVPGIDVLAPFDPSDEVDGYLLNLFAAKPDRVESLTAQGWLVTAPTPPESAALEPYHWGRTLTSMPYGQKLAGEWGQKHDNHQAHLVRESLALWAFAQDSSHPSDQRLGALEGSYKLLTKKSLAKDLLSCQISLARVASELGERTIALQALGQVIQAVEAGEIMQLIRHPFLPPHRRFDEVDPGSHLAEWLEAAALEAIEELGHYSGFFSGGTSRPRLERLEKLRFTGPGMKKRLMVLNQRTSVRRPVSPCIEQPNQEQIARSKEALKAIEASQLETAKAHLAEARRMGDTCSTSLHLMAKAYTLLGFNVEALPLLQRAVELNPDNPAIGLELGLVLKEIGKTEAAETLIEKAAWDYGLLLATGEGRAVDFYNLGLAYKELGDRTQAMDCFRRASEIDPGFSIVNPQQSTTFIE